MKADEIMLIVENVSKIYKLGEIGGTTLRDELQRLKAKILKREDPTKKIGAKNYNKGEKFKALDNISFEVKKGERIGIIGHNGAGKSTLLKLISRVTGPTDGNIYLNGRVASMLEVGTGFHPELTGRENIYMNGAILGMTKKEIDAKMEDIIEFSEVRQFIDTPVKRYSSGMYVKLAFSVAAHLDSEIMIMDEVLAVGDVSFQNKCLSKMKSVSELDSKTILYVSHNMSTISTLCNRVIVLDSGRIIFDGDVTEGIGIYLSKNLNNESNFLDLSTKRDAYLPQHIDAKILNLLFLNKEKPVYSLDELMEFELKVELFKNVKKLGIRMELIATNGKSVGTMMSFVNEPLISNHSYFFKLTGRFDHLVEDSYFVTLVLFEMSDGGVSCDLDCITSAFSFKLTGANAIIRLNWNISNWGNVYFEPFKIDVSQRGQS